MEFRFNRFESETVLDNHGCPAVDRYQMAFNVDGILFQAKSNCFYSDIDIYHGHDLIATIDLRPRKHNAQDWKQCIKEAFDNNDELKKFFHKEKGTYGEIVANDIAKLLSDPALAWD